MKISESKLIEIANYWQTQYEKTGKKGDLANGLIAIKDACDLNPWNKEYADLNQKMEDEFNKLQNKSPRYNGFKLFTLMLGIKDLCTAYLEDYILCKA